MAESRNKTHNVRKRKMDGKRGEEKKVKKRTLKKRMRMKKKEKNWAVGDVGDLESPQ